MSIFDDESVPAPPPLVMKPRTQLGAPEIPAVVSQNSGPADEFTGVGGGAGTPDSEVTFSDIAKCRWCGGLHPTNCPYIYEVEYWSSGQIRRIMLQDRDQAMKAIIYTEEDYNKALGLKDINGEESTS